MNSSNRDPGQLVFSSNIERQVEAPLDASMLVRTASALTDPNTFKSINDGNDYSFPGMIVAVIDDVDDYKNGLYILKNLPLANPDNWVQFQPAYDNRLKTKSTHIVSSINELRSSAIAFLKEHNDEYDTAINQLNATTKRLDNNIDELKLNTFNKIDSLDNKYNNKCDYLQTQLNNANDSISNNQSNANQNISKIETNINTITGNIDNIESDIADIKSGISAIETDISAIGSDVNNNIKPNIINIKSDISAIETIVSGITGYEIPNIYSSLNTRDTTLSALVSSNYNAVRVETYEILNTRDTTLSSIISANSRAISATNTRIDELNTKLDNTAFRLDTDILRARDYAAGLVNGVTESISSINIDLNGGILGLKSNVETISTITIPALEVDINCVGSSVDDISGIVSGNIYYTNTEPTPTTIGGISANTRFENKPIIDILNDLLYPETTPTLIPPSCSINGKSTQVEVGNKYAINVNADFNKGLINPVYDENGKYIIDSAPWAGDATKYTYYINGNKFTPGTEYSIKFTTYKITGSVEYKAGDYNQYTSKGTLVTEKALSAVESTNSIQITGTAPYFATTSDITKLTRAANQISPTTTYVEINMKSEDLTNKQAILVPKFWLDTNSKTFQIQQYDTASKTWNKISTSSFTITEFNWDSPDKTIVGNKPYAVEKNISDFSKYVYIKHNSETTGARQLRIYK